MSSDRAEPLEFIQGLRGVAAAAVVLYHARIYIDGPDYQYLGSRLLGSGAAGVDLFFVISGLIMVHTTRHLAGAPRDALAFLARRFARIWPVYIAAFVATWLLTRSLTGPAFDVTWESTARTLAFFPQDDDAAAPAFGYPLVEVGWTLTYEAAFYLAFGLALAMRRWRWLILTAMFGACVMVWPLLAVGHLSFDAMQSYGLHGYANIATSPILWDFAFGVGIGLLRGTGLIVRDRGLLGCFVALAVGAVAWQFFSGFHAGHGPTRWGFPMAVMVLALTFYDKAHPIRVPPWLRWLGDISFSLYLFHLLPRVVTQMVDHPQLMSGGGYFIASIVAALVMGYLSHRWLERGLSEWLRRRLLRTLSAR